MKRVLLMVVLLIVVSGCASEPRKDAQAFQIRSQAQQDALNSETVRAHQEELNAIETQQRQLEEQHREAIAAEWRKGLNTLIHYGFIFVTIGLCAFCLVLAYSFSRGAIGVANATARMAEVRANLIQLNANTRQFPLVVQHVHGSRYALHNPNTGSVLLLDENREADRQLIATSGATQIAGVIAQEARQSSDPAGMAIMQPPVIDVQDGSLMVGRDVWRSDE